MNVLIRIQEEKKMIIGFSSEIRQLNARFTQRVVYSSNSNNIMNIHHPQVASSLHKIATNLKDLS